jgi:hypothetical protein
MKSARMDFTGQHRKPGLHGRGFAARASGLPLSTVRRALGVLLFAAVFLTSGMPGHRFVSVGQTSSEAHAASSESSLLREIITSGRLTDLRWPDLSDYRSSQSSSRRTEMDWTRKIMTGPVGSGG